MKKLLATILPTFLNLLYLLFIYDHYNRYFSFSITQGFWYVPPKFPSIIEDIVGFGFYFNWVLVLLIWLPIFWVSKAHKSRGFKGFEIGFFSFVSLIDCMLYEILFYQFFHH